MGQEIRGVPEASSLTGTGIGHYLSSQRRLRGISLDELAGRTKIPRRSLERLEAGSFDTASDGFVRSFVRAVASSMGLDPDEAVMRLIDEPAEVVPPESFGWRPSRWLAGALALAGVGLVLVGLWWLLEAWLAPTPQSDPRDVILRRDPVRALAGEAAPAPARDTAPVAP
ncbi:MAG: helix-turn-helix domain-containing protein [Deltaproteobacteria bacterium]|nr:helix-turn-helix domain-containing protein [Deltaproteobacteria bacterium]MBW2360357.1 helix-turn-helix domain-containing protein [Deltaproteobacteria bacterium]